MRSCRFPGPLHGVSGDLPGWRESTIEVDFGLRHCKVSKSARLAKATHTGSRGVRDRRIEGRAKGGKLLSMLFVEKFDRRKLAALRFFGTSLTLLCLTTPTLHPTYAPPRPSLLVLPVQEALLFVCALCKVSPPRFSRQNAVRALAHGLSSPRFSAHGAVQLPPGQADQGPVPAAHRGHRSGSLRACHMSWADRLETDNSWCGAAALR